MSILQEVILAGVAPVGGQQHGREVAPRGVPDHSHGAGGKAAAKKSDSQSHVLHTIIERDLHGY